MNDQDSHSSLLQYLQALKKVQRVMAKPRPSLMILVIFRCYLVTGVFSMISSTKGFITKCHSGGIKARQMASRKLKGILGILSVSSKVVKTLQAFMWWSEWRWNLKVSQLLNMFYSLFHDEIQVISFLSQPERQISPQCSTYSIVSTKANPISPSMRKKLTFSSAAPTLWYSFQANKKSAARQAKLASTQPKNTGLLQLNTNLWAEQQALMVQEQQFWFLGLVIGSLLVPTCLW